jgi:phosphoribosylformylglycinamidine cyclo-ligase
MLIQRESKESWRDMFQDYNMGVGFEMILEEDAVEPALSIIESFGVKAKLIGKIEASSDRNQVLIESGFGKFAYNEA